MYICPAFEILEVLKRLFVLLIISVLTSVSGYGQEITLSGKVHDVNGPIALAKVVLKGENLGTYTDDNGEFTINKIPRGNYILKVYSIDYKTYVKSISIKNNEDIQLDIVMENNSQSLEEIVITGVSSATKIRENPLAISTISAKQIDLTPRSNIMDALVANTPGLNVVKTGPNISKPFIRGLGYNRVLTLYDGVRQEGQQWGDEHGLEVDDYSIHRAEVIKGPASLMYGSDALAGIVSLFPYIPNHDDKKIHGKVVSEYQTNNGLIGNGLQLAYNDDHFLFALRGSYRMAKNYKNPIDGPVYLTNYNVTNFSGLVGYKTKKGYTHLNFTLYNDDQGIPDGSRDSISRKFTKQLFEDDLDDDDNRPIVSDKDLNSYKVPVLSQHIQHYRLYLHSFYDLGKGNIDILLAAQQNRRREYNHPTQPNQAGMYVRLNTLNYGVRYSAPTFANIETSFGINGMVQNNKNLDATDFPIPDYDLFDLGGYIYANWKKERWTISGGLRYDMRHEKWDNFYVGLNPETGFNHQVESTDDNAELPFPSFSKTFQDFSASLGATFKISKHWSVKANVGRAFRAPNITELASNGLDPGAHIFYIGDRTFDPEISLQEDIGISAHYENLSADLSLFNNNIQNYIYLNAVPDEDGNPLVDAQGNRTYKYQQDKAHLYGGEFMLNIHPHRVEGLNLRTSMALVYGFNKNSEYRKEGVKGEYLPLIPPFSLKSDLSYEVALKSKWFKSITPSFGFDYIGEQNRFLGLNNSETATSSYALFNIGFSTDIVYFKENHLQFLVHVSNLLDKSYHSHLSRLKYAEDYENGNGIYDMGRNVTFKLIFHF